MLNPGTEARARNGQVRHSTRLASRRADALATASHSPQQELNPFAGGENEFSPAWATLSPAPNQTVPCEFVQARAGDHLSIYNLLLAIFQGPAPAEFQALHDQPDYHPSDRLLIKRCDRILAHVMISRRRQHFGLRQLPTCELLHLATLPEYRGLGNTKALLKAAQQQMAADGAELATLRTEIPAFFEKRGWAVCGRHSYSTASPRDILAQIEATKPPKRRFELEPAEPITIRLWRHVEQDALMRIYEQNVAGRYGPLQRGHDYWRWLSSRQAYDRIYVAIRGTEKLALGEDPSRIIGYSVMKGGRILELLTLPGQRHAAVRLLARACGDAIERDDLVMRLDAAPNDPLHRLLQRAGGTLHLHESDAGEVFMARLFDPPGFLDRLAPELHQRAKAAEIDRPCELGLAVGRSKYRVILAARSVRIEEGRLGRSYLACDSRALVQLLLGHLDVPTAVASGRLEASTAVAVRMARVIFPRLPLWHPPLDDLPTQ